MVKIEQILEIDKRDNKQDVILYKGEAWCYFDSGLTRHVFTNKNKTKVIKFLIEKDHYNFNKEEFDVYEKAKDRQYLAFTTLELNGNIIEQEFCNPIKFDERKLTMKQMLFANRCRNEVGWDKYGNLKCFDLSEYNQY